MAFPATGPARRLDSWYQGAPRWHHLDEVEISRSPRVPDAWGQERRRTGKFQGIGRVRHRTVPTGIGRKPSVLLSRGTALSHGTASRPPVGAKPHARIIVILVLFATIQSLPFISVATGAARAPPCRGTPGTRRTTRPGQGRKGLMPQRSNAARAAGRCRAFGASRMRRPKLIFRRPSPGFISPNTAGSPLMVRRVRRTSRSPGIGAEPANSSPITGTANLARCPDIWYVAIILPTRLDTPAERTRCGLSSTSDTFRAGIA